ncbi:MAG: endonuclease/exonuclease/phosphatase family protein [Balneola sp.]|nr:MAG: endonuclease/exonuclease/phosphatase family protein [Balneola sp.]
MKKTILTFLITTCISLMVLAQDYSAMTYNIRYNTQGDGVDWWENRKEWVADVINFYEPDVLGIQEGLHGQVMYLDSALIEYSYVGVGRDDGLKEGEYAAIYFKEEKLAVLDSGTFWLSETPNEPSYGWGANFRRITTWAEFQDKDSGDIIWVLNAHFDHETPLARLNGAKLMLEKLESWNTTNDPVIVMGDFNAIPEAEPIQVFSSELYDSKEVSQTSPIGPIGTYNGFDVHHPLDNRIDYIFVNGKINVQKYAVISETRDQRTPSDHLPVYIKFNTN